MSHATPTDAIVKILELELGVQLLPMEKDTALNIVGLMKQDLIRSLGIKQDTHSMGVTLKPLPLVTCSIRELSVLVSIADNRKV